MIGDNTQCPTKNCKTHLTVSHVFSISTLRAAVVDQQSTVHTSTPSCSDSELSKVSESHSLSCPEGSSKIKAALELLLSLSKPSVVRVNSIESIDSQGKIGTSVDSHYSTVKVGGEKAIVFSQWTRMLDLLEGFLKNSSIQYRRLDGTMPIAARDRAVKDFNTIPEVCQPTAMLLICFKILQKLERLVVNLCARLLL